MTYRNNGAKGALLDEYEKAVHELIDVIDTLSTSQLVEIVDQTTKDPDCRSVQTILGHVIESGYNYVIAIRQWLGEDVPYKKVELQADIKANQLALKAMFVFNEKLFEDYPNLALYEKNPSKKIKVRWGQYFDVEQLLEHAIVHVLRHRRQIERFKLKMSSSKM